MPATEACVAYFDRFLSLEAPLLVMGGLVSTSCMSADRGHSKSQPKKTSVTCASAFGPATPARKAFGDNYDPWWSLDDHPLVKSGGSWSTSHTPSDKMCSKDPSKMTAVVTAFMFGLWHGPLAAMPAQRAFGDNYDP